MRLLLLKREFDTDVKIESYCNFDGEQLHFYKKVHIKKNTEQKEGVLVIFILLQETKNLFDKSCTHENVKYHIQHEKSWLRGIVLKQVNYQ